MRMGIEYKKEFFDREYSLGETYGRVWKYARRYWLRIFIGIATGILTAGTLLPIFQVVQPAVEKVSANEAAATAGKIERAEESVAAPAVAPDAASGSGGGQTRLERELAAKSRLPSWYPKAEKLARKCGIDLQTKEGGISGALLLIAVFVIPLVAAVRFEMFTQTVLFSIQSGAYVQVSAITAKFYMISVTVLITMHSLIKWYCAFLASRDTKLK